MQCFQKFMRVCNTVKSKTLPLRLLHLSRLFDKTEMPPMNIHITAVFSFHILCKPCSLHGRRKKNKNHMKERKHNRHGDRNYSFSLSLQPRLSPMTWPFLMDFLIFLCEVIWYVFIWVWLAPHGAGGGDGGDGGWRRMERPLVCKHNMISTCNNHTAPNPSCSLFPFTARCQSSDSIFTPGAVVLSYSFAMGISYLILLPHNNISCGICSRIQSISEKK